jgi:hypothetical protein
VPSRILAGLPPSRTDYGQSEGYLFIGTTVDPARSLSPTAGLDVLVTLGASVDGRSVRFH